MKPREGCMWLRISSYQIDNFRKLSSRIVNRWGVRLFAKGWHRLGIQLLVSVGAKKTCSFASQSFLRILCRASLAKKASGRVVLMTYSRVSFYPSLHRFIPRKLNTPLLRISDLSGRFLDQKLRFLHCRVRKPASVHFCHTHGQAHVGLFYLYPTSLSCHSGSHVENLQGISYGL
jgi:hypothetical protein